jgi:ubiquinone/menaquinone biosynthesis C-methylase UbiE
MDLEPILVCPRSKQPMTRSATRTLEAPCGFQYEEMDFRVPLDFAPEWAHGQVECEEFAEEWLSDNDTIPGRMEEIDKDFLELYQEIPLRGRVLDVGGWVGLVVVQAHLDPDDVVVLDPIAIDFAELRRRYPTFAAHYAPAETASHVQANAEFLPLADCTFDTVHMRSCLDHFASPTVALAEAFRVLDRGGSLVVSMSLKGAYERRTYAGTRLASAPALLRQAVERLREHPSVYGLAQRARFWRHHDPHMFHPTHEELQDFITKAGFEIRQEVWLKDFHNVVCVRAEKVSPAKAATG